MVKKRQIKHGEGLGGRTRLWVTRYNLDSVTGIGNQGFGDIRSYRPMLAFLPFFCLFAFFFFFFLESFLFLFIEYKRKRIYRENRLLLVQSCEETCSREEQKQWKRVFL